MADDFDFSMFGLPFGIPMPPGMADAVMRIEIAASKAMRTLYEEHLRNGFTEEQALALVDGLQRDVIRAIAHMGGEVGKVLMEQQPREGD